MVDSFIGDFSVSLNAKLEGEHDLWTVTAVYGPCDGNLRFGFFEELGRVREAWEGP